MKPAASQSAGWASSKPPLLRFLDRCYRDFSSDTAGTVADYIPELGKADPEHFGIGLATLDGHVYEVGDTKIEFTIQSMSKPFVFALALDTLGAGRVESAIGVEPSGDPFNSIRLNAENHPFNPMVNAGAIACSGLIHEAKGDDAFEYIRQALGRFAGRELGIDEAVYSSESATGDRNRATPIVIIHHCREVPALEERDVEGDVQHVVQPTVYGYTHELGVPFESVCVVPEVVGRPAF